MGRDQSLILGVFFLAAMEYNRGVAISTTGNGTEALMKLNSHRFSFLALIVLFVGLAALLAGCTESHSPAVAATPEGYLFCFWNVENFFDDQEDDRLQGPDRDYDRWYAKDPAILKLKLTHITEALIDMNAGRGPDIIALAEVESQRAAE